MQDEKQIPSPRRQDIFCFGRDAKSIELDKRGFDGTGTRAGGVTPLTSREQAPRREEMKRILDPRFSL